MAGDIEAVRPALGYPEINFYGQSYGTIHAQAYALRHGSHLRSLILDGAFSPLSFTTAEGAGAGIAAAGARTVALVCRRSPSRARDNRDPETALARLAERVRSRPVTGTARDAEGTRKRVRVGEVMLARIAVREDFSYTGQSELPAACAALERGDRRPLVRLAANTGPDYGRFVAGLFPRSRFVLVRNGGHTPGFYSPCSGLRRARRRRSPGDRALSAEGAGGAAGPRAARTVPIARARSSGAWRRWPG